MDIQEIEWESMDWVDLFQGTDKWQALVDMLMNHKVS